MDPRQTAETFHTIQPLLFWLVAGLTGLCAIATVVTQNIVRAATWLLFTLAGTSAIFFLLGADLVGATQLLVYVGGTLVLVIFGVMLTAQGPFISMKTSGAEWAISVVAGLLLLAVLMTGILHETSLGPSRVKMPGVVDDAPAEIYRWPEVVRYAPPLSRAQREERAARPQDAAGPAPAGPAKGPGGPKGPPGNDGPKGPAPGKKGDGKGPPAEGAKAGGPEKGAVGPGGPAANFGLNGAPAEQEKGGPGPAKKGDGKGEAGKGLAPEPLAGGPNALPPNDLPSLPQPGPAVRLDPATSPQSATLGQGFLGVGVGPAHPGGNDRVVRTSYLLPFEIVSVHLLVVLIGAAYLARAKRRAGAP
jgi:NADH:ubiquinone oxidoreductase subunit 6 (subunit J)